MIAQVSDSIAFAEDLFRYGEVQLVALMGTWTFALRKNYPRTRGIIFRTIPFLLGIALFSLAFYSERFHRPDGQATLRGRRSLLGLNFARFSRI